ncbi:MAG TPA: hypothetical protein VGA53_05105 [Candidatus Paceibacterota bacterium]
MSNTLLKIGGIFALLGAVTSLFLGWEIYSLKDKIVSQQEIAVALSVSKEVLEQEEEKLNQKAEELSLEKTVLQERVDILEDRAYQEAKSRYHLLFLPSHLSSGEATGKSVRILQPNGGEALCVGTSYPIQWESKGIQSVSINATKRYKDGSTVSMGIAAHFPANINEEGRDDLGVYVWHIKDDMLSKFREPFGDGYEIHLVTLEGDSVVEDRSDASFAIHKCS